MIPFWGGSIRRLGGLSEAAGLVGGRAGVRAQGVLPGVHGFPPVLHCVSVNASRIYPFLVVLLQHLITSQMEKVQFFPGLGLCHERVLHFIKCLFCID